MKHDSVAAASLAMVSLKHNHITETEPGVHVPRERISCPNSAAATVVAASAPPPSRCGDLNRHTAAVSLRYTDYLIFHFEFKIVSFVDLFYFISVPCTLYLFSSKII